jgi:hypothetical protein
MPSGVGGYIRFPSGRRDVRRWNVAKDADVQDATDSAAAQVIAEGGNVLGWKDKEPTLLEWSGSCEALWKTGLVLDADLSIDIGDVLAVTLHVGTTGLGYTGTIVVKHVETTNDATGPLLMQSVNFDGKGALVGPIAVPP